VEVKAAADAGCTIQKAKKQWHCSSLPSWAKLAGTESGRRPLTLMYLEVLKNVELLWGYNLIKGKKMGKKHRRKSKQNYI
jgi:hypothetical protein